MFWPACSQFLPKVRLLWWALYPWSDWGGLFYTDSSFWTKLRGDWLQMFTFMLGKKIQGKVWRRNGWVWLTKLICAVLKVGIFSYKVHRLVRWAYKITLCNIEGRFIYYKIHLIATYFILSDQSAYKHGGERRDGCGRIKFPYLYGKSTNKK